VFHGTGRDDAKQHWLTCEAIWSVKKITNEVSKIDLMWYMKYKAITPVGQVKYPTEIKRNLLRQFQNPKT
jgi:hypothetical protein